MPDHYWGVTGVGSGHAFCREREVWRRALRQSVPGWMMVAFGAKRTLFGPDAEWLGRE